MVEMSPGGNRERIWEQGSTGLACGSEEQQGGQRGGSGSQLVWGGQPVEKFSTNCQAKSREGR